MADSLSRSEIESLLAATRADSALRPQTVDRVDNHVDFDSFDHDAAAQDFFAKLAQDTVDSLNQSTGLDLTIADVCVTEAGDSDSQITTPDQHHKEPVWRIDMVDANRDPWSIVFDSDFVCPLITSILGSPVDDGRPVQKLSFIEQRLVQPVFARLTDDLNTDRNKKSGHNRTLQNVSDVKTGDGKLPTLATNTEITTAECHIEGAALASKIVFHAPTSACFGTNKPLDSPRMTGTTVQIEAGLASTTISSDDISNLEIGDILMTDIDPESLLIASVDNVPAFRGTMGIFQGRKALLIAEKVAEIR